MATKSILISNPNILGNEKTHITSRYTGGTEVSVENGEGFSASAIVVFGKPGYERAEQGIIASATGLTLTLSSALSFPHNQDDPVFVSSYDKYSLEYQSTAGGAWTVFSGMPGNIEWDDSNSEFLTPAGTYYAFRWRFYNSQTGAYSSYSPTMPADGWDRRSGAEMIKRVRRLIRDKSGELATNEEILEWLDDGQDYLKDIRKKWWFLRVEPSSFTATKASVSKYGLPDDFDYMEKVMYHYSDGSNTDEIYRLRYKKAIEFDALQADQNQDANDEVSYYTLRAPDTTNEKGYIELYSTPSTASQGYKPIYFKEFTKIDSAGDKTDCPRPQILEYHAASIILDINDRETASARMETKRDREILMIKGQNKRVLDAGNNFLSFGGQRGYSKLHQRGGRLSRDSLHTNYFTDEFR